MNITMAEWTMGASETTSSAVTIPDWAEYIAVFTPTITTAGRTVSMQVSYDGSNYAAVKDTSGNTVTCCAANAEPCWVDVTDYLRAFNGNSRLLKFVASDTPGGALTGYVAFKGN